MDFLVWLKEVTSTPEVTHFFLGLAGLTFLFGLLVFLTKNGK